MPNEDFEPVSVTVDKIKVITKKAILVVDDRGNEGWVPLSQIDDDSEVYGQDKEPGDLIIPMWLAEEKGFSI